MKNFPENTIAFATLAFQDTCCFILIIFTLFALSKTKQREFAIVNFTTTQSADSFQGYGALPIGV